MDLEEGGSGLDKKDIDFEKIKSSVREKGFYYLNNVDSSESVDLEVIVAELKKDPNTAGEIE